jgi:hypothetical protein
MGTIATLAAAYCVHMYKVMQDDFREHVKEIRQAAKAEAEYRAQEMFADLLKQAQITVKQEITLENDSTIDWGDKDV